MKKNTKRFVILAAAGLTAAALAVPALAGTWQQDGGAWRYEDDGGTPVKSGWIKDRGEWYFFAADEDGLGAMQTGWINQKGSWYYLDPDTGAMVSNRVIDGYYINEEGIWEDGGNARGASSREDEEEDEWLDEDQADWGTDGADSGPGYDMKDLTRDNGNGPGGASTKKSSSKVYTPEGTLAEKTTYTSGSVTPSSYNDKRYGSSGKSHDEDDDEDEDDYDEDEGYDDDESGGSKADWIALNGNGYRKEDEKPESKYDTNGSNFDYDQTTIKDESGDTRTIIKKTRVRGSKADDSDDDD